VSQVDGLTVANAVGAFCSQVTLTEMSLTTYSCSYYFKDDVMAKALWKNFERYVAAIFGTERTALSGGNGKVTRSDSHHPLLFLSCKYSQANNKGLRDLLTEERDKAKVENKTAVCVIGEAGDRANSLVVFALKDIHKVIEALNAHPLSNDLVPSSQRPKPVST
jgi:hypothetical protein